MKKLIIIILFYLHFFSFNAQAQTPGFGWGKSFKGSGQGEADARLMEIDSYGNIYLAGHYSDYLIIQSDKLSTIGVRS
ncbi:MAG: hypothetical protein H0X62_09775 [Bacteroidetes bacterium]|nr:hypothetical protein [Bacteroidota bacterium]